tara:strand:- start:416 stop:1168 length:753 start_codon:yes stop_codon:yes gene_type:complete
MAKILYKKSYQLKSLKPKEYDDLWGKKGIFTTIRVLGEKPKFILFNEHINNMNDSLNQLNIKYKISKKTILALLEPILGKIRNKDNLLRIAINSKCISLSLRPRLKPYRKFIGIINNHQRSTPNLKNLYYKKIIKFLNSIDSQKQEIILCNQGLLLEGCTTNILCVHKNKIYIPLRGYYRGTTIKYLLNKINKPIKKINISLHNLNKFEEIILVGSGKGVINLSSIPKIKWKSKSNLVYKEFSNLYKKIL